MTARSGICWQGRAKFEETKQGRRLRICGPGVRISPSAPFKRLLFMTIIAPSDRAYVGETAVGNQSATTCRDLGLSQVTGRGHGNGAAKVVKGGSFDSRVGPTPLAGGAGRRGWCDWESAWIGTPLKFLIHRHRLFLTTSQAWRAACRAPRGSSCRKTRP
jgi:hypothetical protein